ncbi:MAG: DUF438 domain-containing protein [Bacteroidetes bacterium]|nr:DUF438 domain-containing protein [Bacteroidota bacterium]
MNELSNTPVSRKELLKHMILQLHEGIAPKEVKQRILELLQKIPYGDVVEVEQELIREGLPETEILRLCDLHSMVLEDSIDLSGAKVVPAGHPVDTFKKENRELEKVVIRLTELFESADHLLTTIGSSAYLLKVRALFNSLMDVDKHYRRKEYLLFPYLEKYGITGPPAVMWGKHDETRGLLLNATESLYVSRDLTSEELQGIIEIHLKPAVKAIPDMIMKEEEILFPMTMDKLTDSDWYEIYKQTTEIGYCLYDPAIEWKPAGVELSDNKSAESNTVHLPSGSLAVDELFAILNSLPVDLTFVDKNDKVKYFTQGKERIFDRNRAILGRDVRMCHPPSSVHVVDQILSDFKSGKADSAPFWINMQGKFIHIEYYALRNEKGEYLGTLEASQDLTERCKLSGEQRILSYKNNN